MIKLVLIEGRSAPLLFCDHCGKRIENVLMAAAVFARVGEGESSPVKHVHKGECHRETERVMNTNHWQELSTHLRYLIDNVSMTPEWMVDKNKFEEQHGKV